MQLPGSPQTLALGHLLVQHVVGLLVVWHAEASLGPHGILIQHLLPDLLMCAFAITVRGVSPDGLRAALQGLTNTTPSDKLIDGGLTNQLWLSGNGYGRPTYLPMYLPTYHLPMHLPTYLPTYLSTNLPNRQRVTHTRAQGGSGGRDQEESREPLG